MNLDSYQQYLLNECRKIAASKRDVRPGEPTANVPLNAWDSVNAMIDAGLLKVVQASPSGRRTLDYLVAL